MKLWIRSQDETKIEQVFSLCTFEISDGKETKYVIENSDSYLGEYKSKERALEVLDEVENILNKGYVLGKEKYDETSGCYYEPQNNVFEMPKE